MSEIAIDVRDLVKSYGDLVAVGGVDLRVETGEIYALLGPNGAGKTTIVEIMEGHRTRTSGEVTVLGHDPSSAPREFRARIGIVLQATGVEPFLTVEEAVELYRGYYPAPLPLDEIIDIVGLADKRTTRVNQLSGGQQRRLDVAIGLAGDPELLFLDEPTTGFDPSARRNAWDMIRNLKELGKTVFLTTHYMDEAQHLADRVGILVAGEIVAEGPPATLAGRDAALTRIGFEVPPGTVLPEGVAAATAVRNGRAELRTSEPLRVLRALTTWALDEGVEIGSLSVTQPSLEDVYLELTEDASEGRAP